MVAEPTRAPSPNSSTASSVPRLGSEPFDALAARGVRVPRYDRSALHGGIVHLGIGGFHRAHLAAYVDDLAHLGNGDWSITGSGVMAHDSKMIAALQPQHGMYLLAEREASDVNASVVGALTNLVAAQHNTDALVQMLADPSTRICSLTITEGGYPVEHGSFVETAGLAIDVRADHPSSTFGVIIAALEARRKAGLAPFTVLSCDNLPGNGHVASITVLGAAELRSPELATWLRTHGAFPNAMVDRITPATTDADRAWVAETFGVEDAWPVVCEPFRQWALEDKFVLGRPDFGAVGALMTDDVIPYEHMKLRLLNGSHSGLAYLSALAGITYVHDAVLDQRIQGFMRRFMATEAAPNLVAPAGIDLAEYQEALVRRFSNPAIADTIARLCLDGTAKFPTFIVPTVEAQIRNGGPLRMSALLLAGWCRYLRGVGDDGRPLTRSGDPFLDEAVDVAQRSEGDPAAFLRYERALGPNLGTSDRLLALFSEALASLAERGALATVEQWLRIEG